MGDLRAIPDIPGVPIEDVMAVASRPTLRVSTTITQENEVTDFTLEVEDPDAWAIGQAFLALGGLLGVEVPPPFNLGGVHP